MHANRNVVARQGRQYLDMASCLAFSRGAPAFSRGLLAALAALLAVCWRFAGGRGEFCDVLAVLVGAMMTQARCWPGSAGPK
jgi:hypothetical protein